MESPKFLYLQTFGCQMNVSDSEKIASLLAGVGYQLTEESTAADLIILNTCTVRAKAEEKVYRQLENLRPLKRKKPSLLFGVGGCVAQQEGERLLEKVPYLDLVFGTHNLHRIPQIVLAAEEGRRLSETDFIDNETRLGLFPSDDQPGGVTRFVTVMQGCDNYCSYCIVPYVRGREISRRSADIIAEISQMAANGVKEITLLGQNVNSYGLNDPDQPDFAGLLRMVSDIVGIERIRFTTSHPKDITRPLIDCFAQLPKLCGHIHLPAQAGSSAVLARMNRGYTRQDYLDKVAALRAARPDIAITSDIIVGFPGESEADFAETLSLVEETRYTDIFSFIYSKRPGTAAAEFDGDLPYDLKLERLDRLAEVQKKITREFNKAQVGSVQKVLVERASRRPGQIFGRSSYNQIVNFDGDISLVGSLADVEIIEGYQNSLLGRLVTGH
ncbi:tRNA (N6-isopentenyl adenosine(37)-C2)-methylthiotransferase MiaB [Geobacter pelophilus]|uniref:tRNA-2-methylthio-N(6)-dimethylallyladenosine synthase n=1 Tax=Geoanaerobacter pelophilus TaxID=60036 RepID=A0AAW4L3H2_9BACT|nr:tRNA (N6-isopentenyl adenosine(37)-C2)-methylthiotransferase MiaB [Geoanaerobacter pelophilus]MBT0663175.1 tRNA (N6-isopentenyl adenosine(37)-C2)-methylthiotransferase MiaB [Geoanaerobacter pelophilus]